MVIISTKVIIIISAYLYPRVIPTMVPSGFQCLAGAGCAQCQGVSGSALVQLVLDVLYITVGFGATEEEIPGRRLVL